MPGYVVFPLPLHEKLLISQTQPGGDPMEETSFLYAALKTMPFPSLNSFCPSGYC